MTAIRAENLCKTFRAPRGRMVEAVCDASFSVEGGEIFGILGPNGAGKTTLLRMLGTIITPTSGACWVDGRRAADDPHEARRKIGFLSGSTKLYGRLTVVEVLRFFGRLYRMDRDTIARRTDELIDLLDMGAFAAQRCETLSTGQTQKASIARVLLHEPPILILDEPTLGLDIMTSRTILEFIQSAKQRGQAILFSTHYMTEAEALCDRVALIHGGRMLAVASQEELLRSTDTTDLQSAFLALVDQGGDGRP